MDDHLSKPFNMLALQELLERWMSQSGSGTTHAAALAAQATAKAAAVLDRATLDELARVKTNGKPELLTRVIRLYLSESPELVETLKEAASAGDGARIASSAHTLKSCSANVGAAVLSRYCAEAEALARKAQTEDARRCIHKIETEHRSVQAALESEIETLAGSSA